jgi:hypothetical protein
MKPYYALTSILLAVAGLLGTGCPRGPIAAIGVSSEQMNFGSVDTQRALEVWNTNPGAGTLNLMVSSSPSWISVDAFSVTSNAPVRRDGPFDKQELTITVDRSELSVGQHSGTIRFTQSGIETKVVTVYATRDPEPAIAVSNATLDFELSELPRFLEVWNFNPEVPELNLAVTPSEPWIVVNAQTVQSDAPTQTTGPFDKQTIQVSIDRSRLEAGEHLGSIEFTEDGIETKLVTVRVVQETSGVLGELNVVDPVVTYTDPYLIDFSFRLHDSEGNGVVRDPAEFEVSAREGALSIPNETDVYLQRGAARQLKVALVLDYTQSMQDADNAIATMEGAAKNILLPALNDDALVSVTEFHRDDREAVLVAPFTVDRAYTRNQIDSIQDEFVNGFYSASRVLDAVLDAAETFEAGQEQEESRYILVFTDGDDTSSTADTNAVVNLANERGIRIYAIDFGTDAISLDLEELTERTEGTLFTAATVDDLDDSFAQIVQDLEGQYTVRWASVARNNTPFLPGFTLMLDENSVSYTAAENFVPTAHAGNGPLEGHLRFVSSDSENATTVFLRADYVPRLVSRFKIYLASDTGFSVEAVDVSSDGLLGDWTLTSTEDPENGGITLDFVSESGPMPFGAFGPMLRISFDALLPVDEPLFDQVYVDNTIYESGGGQSFVVEGYGNTPPVE